ncbi:hypothetical protein PVK06_044175 [Gossypium arboreum]|uniref:Uncharacterized protein n=1 Tax=Gossypium arboreum TaxID=29729 RepID=A0ABR0MQR6_GOSAR|nr:hypothetical protein PVK06_044175 [Gossypium arboreum]
MRVSIKFTDERACRSILIGWEPPIANVDGMKTLKPEVTRTSDEDKLPNANSEALNSTFNGVDSQEF